MDHTKYNAESHKAPNDKDEVLVERLGSVMALRVDPLNQTPVFVVEEVATAFYPTVKDAKEWVALQIGDGAQIVFDLGPDGWQLRAANSEFKFSEAQIESFFSQELLQDLWLTHHPAASSRKKYLETLKGRGIH